ncbi:MAG: transposase [Mangrovibacterium sp.]
MQAKREKGPLSGPVPFFVRLEENIPDGFAIMTYPSKIRRLLRTTNMLERLNKEIKRRTKVVMVFPNERSITRLVSALLMEVSQDWETDKVYVRLDEDHEGAE